MTATAPIEVARRGWTRLRADPAAVVVTGAAVAWFVVLAVDVWRRHDRFETFDFDLGFHAHFVWLLSRGDSFSTIVALPAFGHNATFGYFLFVPFAWLGLPLPHVLNLVQTAVLAAGVVPLFRLARRRFDRDWVVAAIPLLYLLHPVVQGNVAETFHPEAMAVTPLLAAYDAADEGRWRRYWVFIAFALLWKADVALFVAALALVAIRRRNRRVAIVTAAIGSAWLVLVVGVLLPSQSGGTAVWAWLYRDLGDTPAEMVETSVRDPSRLVQAVRDGDPIAYGRDLLAPYGFLPVLAPVPLLAAAPQVLLNTIADEEWTRDPLHSPHYQALPTVAMTLAMVEGLAFVARRRRSLLEPAVAVVAACSLASSVAWGALPVSVRYASHWTEDGDPWRRAKELAVALPAGDDVVSATWRFVPHLVERDELHSFPNPWRRWSFGTREVERSDPATVEWIILDLDAVLDPAHREVIDCITDAGTFDEERRDGPIVVLHRNGNEPVDVDCR